MIIPMNAATLSTVPLPPPLIAWLGHAVDGSASDLHLITGYPPTLRLHGELVELLEPALSADFAQEMLLSLCSEVEREQLAAQKNVDFSFAFSHAGRVTRFRVNLFHAGGALNGCLRLVPDRIPDLAWAGFPESLARRITKFSDGLVIVTGATGSGKSATLAMIVNMLNQKGGHRIITVEEPVEYLYPRMPNSVVTQREVGRDVRNFADGLRSGLRQDPDVILVGEIRDQETAQIALSAAETGHLVFSTLHTRDAKGTITRFTDLFPQEAQRDVRSMLALSLRAIIAQRLLPDILPGEKRHLTLEVLINTFPVASAIRQGKLESIDTYLVTGRNEGMISFDESVKQLLRDGVITREVAEQNVRDPSVL
jgi:twitching motility protein PilT